MKAQAMKSHDDRIDKLNQRLKEITDLPNLSQRMQQELTEFSRKWETVFEKICE